VSGGGYGGETAWSGSGGGTSRYESEPSYQTGVQSTGRRSTPDVAYDANPNTGFAVYDSYGSSGWMVVGGTSAGAPQWAALIAIADQGLTLAGKGTLDGAQTRIYQLPGGDFHDVTSGSNGYSAGARYDLVTGLGSPLANLVVGDLVAGTAAQTPSGGSSTGGSSTGGSSTGGSSGGGSSGGGSMGGGGSGGGYYYNPFGGYRGYGYNPWIWFFGGYGYNPFGGFLGGYSYNPWGSWGFGFSGRLGSLDVAASGGEGGGADSGAATAIAAAFQPGETDASATTASDAAKTQSSQSTSTTVQLATSLPGEHASSIDDDLPTGEAETLAIDAYFSEAGEND
jgi:hypothetical protein